MALGPISIVVVCIICIQHGIIRQHKKTQTHGLRVLMKVWAHILITIWKIGEKIIKIQAALCKMIKTLINIILIDRGLSKYINKFTVNMLKPITQEDIDRTEAESNRFRVVSDTLSLFGDIEDKAAKLKILKALLPQVNNNADILEILEEEISKLEKNPEENPNENSNGEEYGDDEFGGSFSDNEPLDLDSALDLETEEEPTDELAGLEGEGESEEGPSLPTPGETGVDLVNGTGEEEI